MVVFRSVFAVNIASPSGSQSLLRAGGKRWFWSSAELVIPVFETERLLHNETQVGTARQLHGPAHHGGEGGTIRIRIHRRDDFTADRHPRHSRPDEFGLLGVRFAANGGVPRVIVRKKNRMRKRIYRTLGHHEPVIFGHFVGKPGGYPAIKALSSTLKLHKENGTAAKTKFIDHYQSILNLIDDLGSVLYPESAQKPTINQEGKILMRILFSSCADTFETYMSDLLYEIYLANPATLKSGEQITVKEVLDCTDMQEFVDFYAKKKLAKLQRGSVKGFIADNAQIGGLGVFNADRQDGVEKLLQIRHLYSHRNGIVDEKFLRYYPGLGINDEHQMPLDDFLVKCEYLAQTVDAVDRAALAKYQLASLG